MNYKYYQNQKCEYFPCHEDVEDFNCKFCFCPLYLMEDCGGTFEILKSNIKDCSSCKIVHENNIGYDFVIEKLAKFFQKNK